MTETCQQGEPMPETCQRCGETGEDRRTLWMACFYSMDELDMPVEQVAIVGKFAQKTGACETRLGTLPIFTPADDAKERQWPFYRLRVCKACRGSWLGAIEDWYTAEAAEDDVGEILRGE